MPKGRVSSPEGPARAWMSGGEGLCEAGTKGFGGSGFCTHFGRSGFATGRGLGGVGGGLAIGVIEGDFAELARDVAQVAAEEFGEDYFFTVNLLDRRSKLLVDRVYALGTAVRRVRRFKHFHIDPWVMLPDHMR